MKKVYIAPALELIEAHTESFITASPAGTQGSWGGGDQDHSNSDFDNEGYNDGSGTVPIGGDNGIIDAQGKNAFDIWADDEDLW